MARSMSTSPGPPESCTAPIFVCAQKEVVVVLVVCIRPLARRRRTTLQQTNFTEFFCDRTPIRSGSWTSPSSHSCNCKVFGNFAEPHLTYTETLSEARQSVAAQAPSPCLLDRKGVSPGLVSHLWRRLEFGTPGSWLRCTATRSNRVVILVTRSSFSILCNR